MLDSLPQNSKNGPSKKNGSGSFTLKLKPTEENNSYRFRLLSFTTGTNTRDYPFIEKFVHEKWEKDAEGKGVFKGFVTCPVTKYVRPTLPPKSNPFDLCPVCKYVNANFLAYKESNYKDKIAGKVIREHKRKYVALVPVYVVKDPHDPTNTNKPRVWVIKDKDVYDKLNTLIKKQQAKTKVFNGGDAVDILVYLKKEQVIINEGKPNEFKYNEIKIDKFGFGKNVYKIDAINDTLIEGFPFDEEFYTFTKQDELERYYSDNVISSNSVPEDGIDTEDLATSTTNTTTTTTVAETEDDSITEDDTKIVTQEQIVDKDLEDIDDLINDAAPEEKPVVVAKVNAVTAAPVKPTKVTTKPAAKPTAEVPKKPALSEPVPTNDEDIDDIINGVLSE